MELDTRNADDFNPERINGAIRALNALTRPVQPARVADVIAFKRKDEKSIKVLGLHPKDVAILDLIDAMEGLLKTDALTYALSSGHGGQQLAFAFTRARAAYDRAKELTLENGGSAA